MELVGRDKKQGARQNVIFPIVNDLGTAPLIEPKDFVKGVLVGVLNIEFAHFLEAGDFKIERLLGSVDEVPNVVVWEDVLHGVKVGIFRSFGGELVGFLRCMSTLGSIKPPLVLPRNIHLYSQFNARMNREIGIF